MGFKSVELKVYSRGCHVLYVGFAIYDVGCNGLGVAFEIQCVGARVYNQMWIRYNTDLCIGMCPSQVSRRRRDACSWLV